jgi:hypothetical protein
MCAIVPEKVPDQSQADHDLILELVTHILWIHAIVFKTFKYDFLRPPEGLGLDNELKTSIEERDHETLRDLYERRIKRHIMAHLKNLTPAERTTFITDDQPCESYREALSLKATKYGKSLRVLELAEREPDLPIPESYHDCGCDTRQDYIGRLGKEMQECHYQLGAFLNVFKFFLKSIEAAARQNLLSEKELGALHIKLEAVEDYYPDAYSVYDKSGSKAYLLNAASGSRPWW